MLEFMQKNIHKLRNKEGVSTIEIIIGMMIFLVVLCFLTDLLMLLWKFSVVAQTTTQVARITGIQGGISSSHPHAWPGGAAYYTDINELHNLVEETFESAGISSGDWNISIGNANIGSGGKKTANYDYEESFTIETNVNYHWDMTSNILPLINLNQTLTARRPAMSEWKFNSNSWVGE